MAGRKGPRGAKVVYALTVLAGAAAIYLAAYLVFIGWWNVHSDGELNADPVSATVTAIHPYPDGSAYSDTVAYTASGQHCADTVRNIPPGQQGHVGATITVSPFKTGPCFANLYHEVRFTGLRTIGAIALALGGVVAFRVARRFKAAARRNGYWEAPGVEPHLAPNARVHKSVNYGRGISLPHTPKVNFAVTLFVAFAFLNAAVWTTVDNIKVYHDQSAARASAVSATVTGHRGDTVVVTYRAWGHRYDDASVVWGYDPRTTPVGSMVRVLPDASDTHYPNPYAPPEDPPSTSWVYIVLWTVLATLMTVLGFRYRRRRITDGRWGEQAERVSGGLRY